MLQHEKSSLEADILGHHLVQMSGRESSRHKLTQVRGMVPCSHRCCTHADGRGGLLVVGWGAVEERAVSESVRVVYSECRERRA